MKFSTIIGSIGVAMLGIVAAGCSAETAESGESIGQTAQAIGTAWSATDNIRDPNGGSPINKPRYGAASCVIRDDNGTPSDASDDIDKMLVAGGHDGTTQGVADTYLFNPAAAAGSKWTKVQDLGTGRYRAKMIQVPGAPNTCMIAGGIDSSGTVLATAEIYTLGSGWANTGSMNESRYSFELVRCGASKLIAIGGRNNSAAASGVIDVFSSGTFTQMDTDAGTGGNQGLKTARYAFAVAPQDTDYDQFLIAGGTNGSVNYGDTATDAMELLSVDSACAYSNLVKANTALGADDRAELVAFPSASNKFLVAGGTTSIPGSNVITSKWGLGALATTREISSINWSTGAVTVGAGPASLPTARSSITLLPLDATLTAFVLVGGRGVDTAHDVSVAKSIIWDGSQFENASGTANTEDTTVTSRYFGAGAFLPIANQVAIASGLVDTKGVTDTNPTITSLAETL